MEHPGQRVVSCPKCRRYYRLPAGAAAKPGARLRCTKCGNLFSLSPQPRAAPHAGGGPGVIAATDGSEMWSIIKEVLAGGGFPSRVAKNGEEALAIIEEWSPRVAVLDVSLPGTPVFEICDRLRGNPKRSGMGIILLASVYEQTRYKRSPTSLYGADDYIEKHHLRDALIPKIRRLAPAAGGVAPPSPLPPEKREEALPEKEGGLGPAATKKEQEEIVREERYGPDREASLPQRGKDESLRRFARIIVSDIALYNQQLIEEGVKKGNLKELLKDEIAEGLRLFQTRDASGEGAGLYEEALEEFVKKQIFRFKGAAGA